MFTGIVQGLGEVTQIRDHRGIRHMQVCMPAGRDADLQTGASIAINGVCLTVTGWDQQGVQFDVIDETLKLTNLGEVQTGSRVNVERAACFGDEIGGHILSGHIHGQAEVTEVIETETNLAVWWRVSEPLLKYVLPKGYVSLNGCSLTVGETIRDGQMSIHLIPETRALTTFGQVKSGDRLNLEIDSQIQAIVDTVERVLEQGL